ncbi:proline-rich protein 36-like [Cydia strobilella]|uniref:proline-rich protein 36-like n=1 Tax=Cydia strobilella TaxID=1100964 RepID=UPI003007CB78
MAGKDGGDDAWRRQRSLLEEEREKKEKELDALDQLMEEAAALDPMRPRHSLARSPPQTAPTTPVAQQPTAKRPLQSPEEVSDAIRKRLGGDDPRRRTGAGGPPAVPPVGGILTSAPPARPKRTISPVPPTAPVAAPAAAPAVAHAAAPAAPPSSAVEQVNASPSQPVAPRGKLDAQELIDLTHQAVRGIGAIANATNKLNIADKTGIATYVLRWPA